MLPPGDLVDLAGGAILRFDLHERRFGSVEAEMHIDVLQPEQLAVEFAVAVSLKWWLRPIAVPFRGRARRWLDGRLDEMIDELAAPRIPADEPEPAQLSGIPSAPSDQRTGGGWTLRVLTPDGRRVYERTDVDQAAVPRDAC